MEPLLLSETSRHGRSLSDLALELVSASAGFRRSLPPGVVGPLADLVRATNCYYSNLIEGHATHPVDIETALAGEYSHDPRKRNLQYEARAHITVQRWIDAGHLRGRATTVTGIRELHLCQRMEHAERYGVRQPDQAEQERAQLAEPVRCVQ